MAKLRLLVVEDSVTVREALVDCLKQDRDLDVVAVTGNGAQAVELCKKHRPDAITMDMMLPGMTGLEATEMIMAYCPTPILIVSSSTNRAEVFRTYEALAAGAVDVLDKPSAEGLTEEWGSRLRSAIKIVSKIKVITHPRARLEVSREKPGFEPHTVEVPKFRSPTCVAIGASTGGPGALVQVLKGLGASFPLPVLIVLHISNPFGASFAEWLDSQSPLPVRFAKDKEPIPDPGKGCVLLAPPDFHLIVKGGFLRITNDPERHSCKPSVGTLFESMAREMGKQTIACLLTGMGKDGAAGMLAVRKAGGLTLAQDERTSLIFGMPKEAIEIGGAEQVLPLGDFAPLLLALAQKKQTVLSFL